MHQSSSIEMRECGVVPGGAVNSANDHSRVALPQNLVTASSPNAPSNYLLIGCTLFNLAKLGARSEKAHGGLTFKPDCAVVPVGTLLSARLNQKTGNIITIILAK
jgi:hypothetical protein